MAMRARTILMYSVPTLFLRNQMIWDCLLELEMPAQKLQAPLKTTRRSPGEMEINPSVWRTKKREHFFTFFCNQNVTILDHSICPFCWNEPGSSKCHQDQKHKDIFLLGMHCSSITLYFQVQRRATLVEAQLWNSCWSRSSHCVREWASRSTSGQRSAFLSILYLQHFQPQENLWFISATITVLSEKSHPKLRLKLSGPFLFCKNPERLSPDIKHNLLLCLNFPFMFQVLEPLGMLSSTFEVKNREDIASGHVCEGDSVKEVPGEKNWSQMSGQ